MQAVGIPVEKEEKDKDRKTAKAGEPSLFNSLLAAGERLLTVIGTMRERSSKEIKKMISEIDRLISRYSKKDGE